MAKTEGPSPIDIHVGSRMRMRRMALGMSQEKLATRLGLTFQQVQKYEKGANRMGSSRLQQAADVLGSQRRSFSREQVGSLTNRSVVRCPQPISTISLRARKDCARQGVYVPTPSGPSSYRRSRERGRG